MIGYHVRDHTKSCVSTFGHVLVRSPLQLVSTNQIGDRAKINLTPENLFSHFEVRQSADQRRTLEEYSVEHAMICKRGGFIIQRPDELRNLEAELLSSV